MRILITENALHQVSQKKKNVILSFTETKFRKDENGNRPLDKDVGRITLKYCIPLILNLKCNVKQ